MKFITLSVMIIGIVLLLNVGGAVSTPVTGGFVNLFYSDPESTDSSPIADIESSSIWQELLKVAGAALAVTIVAGLFGRSPQISNLLGTFVVTFLGTMVLYDSISVFTTLWSLNELWIRVITLMIFIPLLFIFITSLKSYWEGSEA